MGMRRTPPLSLEGSREVLEEMKRPPADTPERRATFERARKMRKHVVSATAERLSPDELAELGECPCCGTKFS